ncbi:calcium/sodium antiporter [soil metagenome]
MTILLLVAGLVLLILGAEALVRGAARIATALGISPLVIGLTVVALGTSSPEIAVTVQSVFAGQSDLAIGNIVGSNIFNILLILGLSAAITPLVVSRQLVRLDVPIMILVAMLVWPLGYTNENIGRAEGALLALLLLAYVAVLVYLGRREPPDQIAYDPDEPAPASPHWLLNLLLIVGGLGMLVLGSRWLVAGALHIAQALGLSALVIGLTIVAAGTSLPEVATSVIAALRGQRDIAVGNVVGSCIFNVLAVLGLGALVAPADIAISPAALAFDIPMMIVVSIAAFPIFLTGYVISRGEGLIFLFYYVAYTSYVILKATEHDALEEFSAVLVAFVAPITVLTALIVMMRRSADRQLRGMQRPPSGSPPAA